MRYPGESTHGIFLLLQVERTFAFLLVVEKRVRLISCPRQRSFQAVGYLPFTGCRDGMVQVHISPLCLLTAFVAPVLLIGIFKIVDQLLQGFILVERIVDTRIEILMAVIVGTCTVQGRRAGSPAGRVHCFDVREIRPSAPVGRGGVLCVPSGVGEGQLIFVVEIILEGSPQVVGYTFVFRPVLLQDIVLLTVHGRFGMHIFRRTPVTVTGRVGEVGRIFLSGVRQVHQPRRREIISLLSGQRHFPFQLLFQAPVVFDDHVDRRTSYAVLGRGTVHHFHLLHLARRGGLQHIGQLFRRHGAFAAVDNDGRLRCTQQGDVVAAFASPRQFAQDIERVVYRLALYQVGDVVLQFSGGHLHQRAFGFHEYFRQVQRDTVVHQEGA